MLNDKGVVDEMTKNPREILKELTESLGTVGGIHPEYMKTFNAFSTAVFKSGAIDVKTKELISVAIGVYSRCEYCIVYHVYNAFKVGATKEEILEAGLVSGAFAGGAGVAYSVTLLKQCIDEFSKDFNK
jgi:AhpD family alkylhydroperoxidase